MSSESGVEDDLPVTEQTPLLRAVIHDTGTETKTVTDVTNYQVKDGEKAETTIVVTEIQHRIASYSPSKGRKCAVLLSCWLLHLLASGYAYSMGVIFVELVRDFEAARTQTALVQSIFTALMTGGGFIFTPLVIKYGAGPCLSLASLVASLGFIVATWSTDLTMVIIFVGLVSGLAMSVFYLCGFVAVSWMFGPSSGAPLVFVTIGTSTGQLLCPYFFDILITQIGWRGTYFMMGAIVLNGLLPAIILHTSRKFYHTGPGVRETIGRSKMSSNNVCDITLFKDPLIMTFMFNCFILDITGLFESWFLVDVMELKGYERSDGSFMLVLVGIGSTVARILAVCLKLVIKIPTVAHWLYVCILVAGCHAVVVSISDYWPLFTASLVYGFSFGIVYAQVPVIMLEVSGVQRYPRAVGLLNFTFGAADLLCGIVAGLVNDLTGSYNLLLYIAIGVALYVAVSSIILALFLYKTKDKSKSTEYNDKTPLVSKHTCTNGYIDKKCLRLYNRSATVF